MPVSQGKIVPSTQRFMVEIVGRLELRTSGLYLVSLGGDYKINTKINVWQMNLVIRGVPSFNAKTGVETINVYEVERK